MKAHGRLLARGAMVLVVLGMIAAHGLALRSISDYPTWSVALASGVIILALLKHLGMLGAFYALLKRRHDSA